MSCHAKCVDRCHYNGKRECAKDRPKINYVHPLRLKAGQEVTLKAR